SIILQRLQHILLGLNRDTPYRNPNGDLAHATAAIYMLMAEAREYHLNLDAAVHRNTFYPKSYAYIYSDPTYSFYEALSRLCVQIMEYFLIPFNVLFKNADFALYKQPQARYERYVLLAKKAITSSSSEAIIEILKAYTARFHAGKPTWRTHRNTARKLATQLERGEIQLDEALKEIAKLETTDDGEFQHALVGIFTAITQDNQIDLANIISNCKVSLGDIKAMSVKRFYRKFINDDYIPAEYGAYKDHLNINKLLPSETNPNKPETSLQKIMSLIQKYLEEPDHNPDLITALKKLKLDHNSTEATLIDQLLNGVNTDSKQPVNKFISLLVAIYALLKEANSPDEDVLQLAELKLTIDNEDTTLAELYSHWEDNASSIGMSEFEDSEQGSEYSDEDSDNESVASDNESVSNDIPPSVIKLPRSVKKTIAQEIYDMLPSFSFFGERQHRGSQHSANTDPGTIHSSSSAEGEYPTEYPPKIKPEDEAISRTTMLTN
ncbi:MAG TPA: hypothetical protein VD770_04170, partial [Coxiellaceae bacterium]|nr:hypothetical protein [Coxiellaceae bacterium]